MSTLVAFSLGVATPFILFVVGYAIFYLISLFVRWCREHSRSNIYLHDNQARSLNAAALMYASKVAAVRLPGGVVLVWRSVVPWKDNISQCAADIRKVARESEESQTNKGY